MRAWLAIISIALATSAFGPIFGPVVARAEPAPPVAPATLRFSGSPADRNLIEALGRAFERERPGVSHSLSLHGPESTISGVYTGTADIALMGREVREPMERMAFEWALLSRPFEVEIATAGLAADRPNAQLAVFVNKANPLTSLSFDELDGILSAEAKRGGRNLTDWGQLGQPGLGGINLVGPSVDSIDALFVRTVVMMNSRKWSPRYRVLASERAVVEAIAHDRSAVGFAPVGLAIPGVRAVALGKAGEKAVALTAQTAADRSYPLARSVRMVVFKPKEGLPPLTADFLRFVLSKEGQRIIAADGHYLPLSEARAEAEARRLGS